MLWFSKRPKLTKEQYEKARAYDSFKTYSKETWLKMLNDIEYIKRNMDMRDRWERGVYWCYDYNWGTSASSVEDKDESWFYNRILSLLEAIGDGWGSGYDSYEYVYRTDDLIISSKDENFKVEELDNGDLLVKETHETFASDGKTISETRVKRYDCGTWKKKTIVTKYKKQLIEDSEYDKLGAARIYCKNYEYTKDKNKWQ